MNNKNKRKNTVYVYGTVQDVPQVDYNKQIYIHLSN